MSDLQLAADALKKASDAERALQWHKDYGQKGIAIRVSACTDAGSATVGGKEMNEYLAKAVQDTRDIIIERAMVLAEEDRDAGIDLITAALSRGKRTW